MSKTDNLSTFLQKKLMLGQDIITVAVAKTPVYMCCNISEHLGPADLSGFI